MEAKGEIFFLYLRHEEVFADIPLAASRTAHYQLQLKDAASRLEVRMAAIRFLEFRR